MGERVGKRERGEMEVLNKEMRDEVRHTLYAACYSPSP